MVRDIGIEPIFVCVAVNILNLVSASDYHFNLAQSLREEYRHNLVPLVGFEPTADRRF